MRGDLAERIPLYTHFSEPEICCSTPAGFLALKLLESDLSDVEWVTSPPARYEDACSTRPRYTRQA